MFDVAWTPTARRRFARLPESVAAAVLEFVYGALAENPHRVGKPLREPFEGSYSARRGEYRVVYEIDDGRVVVTLLTVDHRRDVYRPQ
jgi:mRNA-degrading endonuclease RelE of RelBE toxin-antitoxin system